MLKTIIGCVVLLAAGAASAQSSHSVRGYLRSDGTYVARHMQTNSNSTRMDNWSTQGNVNPYTGRAGTVDRFAPTASSNNQSSSYNPYGYNPSWR